MPNDPRGLTLSFCSDDTAYQFSPLTYHSFLVGFEAFINRFANKIVPVLDHYNGRFVLRDNCYILTSFCVAIFNQILAWRYIRAIYAAKEKKIECD